MRLVKLTLLALLLPACAGTDRRSDDPDTVQMKSNAIHEIEEVEARRARPVEPEQVVEQEEEAPLAIEMFELADSAVRTEAGLQIQVLSRGPSWAIEFDHHGRKFVARHDGDPLYIEGIAFSHLFVVTGEGTNPSVTLRSGELPPPLTEEEAFLLARRERATRLGCDGSKEETSTDENGTSVLRVLNDSGQESCRITVGRFTRSVL